MIKLDNTVGLFTDDEIAMIDRIGQGMQPVKGELDETSKLKNHRASSVAWIDPIKGYLWMFSKFMVAMKKLNIDFVELQSLQYTTYGPGGYYKKHRDTSPGAEGVVKRRVVSAVLQLSDPKEYSGGTLLVYDRFGPVLTWKRRGLVTVFPSDTWHEVTKVTKGLRKTIVAWGLTKEAK